MPKSFYDLDYIIEINEKKLAEYTVSYQKVLERLTNIILVYSALGIFLVPLLQHTMTADIKGVIYCFSFSCFAVLVCFSIVYVVKLLLPAGIAYLEPPQQYYKEDREHLEEIYPGNIVTVDNSLKSSYILDLEAAININKEVFRRKNSFFYNALIFSLLAVIPYVICLGFHLSKKDDKIQKIQVVTGKNP